MEIYSASNNSWIPEELLEMEENHSIHHQFDSLDVSSKEFEYHPLSSDQSYSPLQNSCPKTIIGSKNDQTPAVLLVHKNSKTSKPNKNKKSNILSSNIICFGNSFDSSPDCSQNGTMIYPGNKIHLPRTGNEIKKATREELGMARDSALVQEHALAERKRREKLSQHFIALSALIPGLKKADKASILGDGVKYLKQLQERVKTLEQQLASTKRIESSMAYGNESRFYVDDEKSCKDNSESHCFDHHQLLLPEIETRVCDKDVLIRVHCVNVKGIMKNIICAIEKLQFSVLSSSALPFGDHAIAITIVAQQMDVGNNMKVNDVGRILRHALLKLM